MQPGNAPTGGPVECGTPSPSDQTRPVAWLGCSADPHASQHRLVFGGGHRITVIYAFRCPNCRHDQVLDSLGADGQWWDLDPTDYEDSGSWDARQA